MFEDVGIESLASIPFPKKSKWRWWNISNRLSSTWETWIICVYHVNKRSGLYSTFWMEHLRNMVPTCCMLEIKSMHPIFLMLFIFPMSPYIFQPKVSWKFLISWMIIPNKKRGLVWYQNSTSTIIYRSNLYIIKLYISHDISAIFINFPHNLCKLT